MAISLTYLIFVKSVLVLLSFTMYHTTAKLALVLLNASLLATLATPKLTVAIIVPPIKLLSPSMCISLNPKMNFPVPCSQVSSSRCLRQTTFQIFTTLHCLPVPLHPCSTALLASMVLPLILSPCNWTAWTHLPMTLSPLAKHAVKIILWLTWVTFAIGTWWSALGVGCRARRGEEKAEVGRRRQGEGERDETGTEQN